MQSSALSVSTDRYQPAMVNMVDLGVVVVCWIIEIGQLGRLVVKFIVIILVDDIGSLWFRMTWGGP